MSLTQQDLRDLLPILRSLVRQELVQAAAGRLPIPLRKPATVGSTAALPGDICAVRVDGDAGTLAGGAVNVTGQMLTAGARVMVSFEPPHGALITELVVPGTFATFVPVLIQSVVVANDITYARYMSLGGRAVFAQVNLVTTGAGTTNNKVTVSLPIDAAPGAFASGSWGSGTIYNGGNRYGVTVTYDSTTTITFHRCEQGTINPWGVDPNSGLIAGDAVIASFFYEAAP